ncbi:ABC transporter ATP-binding protein [Gracilinema caldarium]|uniref:ABC transporter ATP-binding protein n=1 Tax=Gracilinema caldarium TaxID=215591 RepID=UPI0026F2310D|nr:ABC transporter ATP-binding protein [Gracilinema caldarium]
MADENQKNYSLREFKTLWPYLAPSIPNYIAGLFCLIIVDLGQILIPLFIKSAIDSLSNQQATLRSLGLLCLGMLALSAIISVGRFLWRYFINGASRRIETEIRQSLFNHLMELSYDFYQKNKIGDLLARAINDLNAVRNALGIGFVAFFDSTVMAIAIIIIMLIQDRDTALFAIIPLPVITLLIVGFGNMIGGRFKKVQESYSSMSETVQETFAGMRVIKSFVKEEYFVNLFAKNNNDYKNDNVSLVKVYGFFFPMISFLSGLTTLILLVIGGGKVIEGKLSAGTLVAMFSYLQMLIWPMLGMGFLINMIQRGAASLGRINEIFAAPPTIRSRELTKGPIAGNSGYIKIKNLSFIYPDGTSALHNITLDIPSRSVMGIMGRTGSGKSTLCKALCRLIDPDDGTVFLDNVDVKDWDLVSLRQRFGMVPQDPFLFSDSIKNNIIFSNEYASENLIMETVALTGLTRDLRDFKDGLDTIVGERGLTLSGGQKQRLSIARAIIKNPDILVLDDAFSAVDTETEQHILNEILKNRKGKTTIIVSHRVSTLKKADFIVILDQGKILEAGTPSHLIKTGGYFAEMAELQRLEHHHG